MKKHLFTLLAGSHQEGGRDYKKGDRVASSIRLDKVFGADKFQPVETVAAEVEESVSPDPLEKQLNPKGTDKPVPGPLGEDVSADFSVAVESDLKVWRKGTSYFVTEPESPAKARNKKALKREEVAEFITELLK